ncbi:catalase-like [Maniola hyperantus]|uniref:catalase-like n=1 Tax=Aphantopus hyperantus TaxID=2795564 RepID=UPI002124B2A2
MQFYAYNRIRTRQLISSGDLDKNRPNVLTTSGGAPVCYADATSALNTNLINNEHFLGMMSNLVRERTPERAVHGQGTGAFGFFVVTHDISHICKADFLKKVGQKTPIAIRFATSGGNKGSADLVLDNRGYSLKFYTREGNFDVAGFNVPVSPFKDPLGGHIITRTARLNPATNAPDANMAWDRATLVPESLHQLMYTYSGRGIPASYRNMPGYPVHTYQVENENGDQYFIRFHFLPDAGIKYMKAEEARKIRADDHHYLTKDLYRAIGKGDFPSWTCKVQILTEADVENEGAHNVFDITKIIPEDRYPLYEVGKLVLNRNAKNFHAEIEQLAFCPCNVVPGIYGAPDKVYEARRLIYRDAQVYRLGGNVFNIPVNCPFQTKAYTYNRDGVPPVSGGDGPNYYPNSFNGPEPYKCEHSKGLIKIVEKSGANNFDQARDLYANKLTEEERTTLIQNIVSKLKSVTPSIKKRALKLFTTIHQDLGARLKQEMNIRVCSKKA